MAKSRLTGSQRSRAPAPSTQQKRQVHTPPPQAKPQPPPQPVQTAPPVQQSSGGGMSMMGNFASAAAGTVVGHTIARGITSMFSSGNDQPSTVENTSNNERSTSQNDVCYYQSQDLMRCMNENGGAIDRCQVFLDQLNQCRKDARYNQ